MSFKKIAIALTCIATVAASPAMANNFKRISNEADFDKMVVGKKITWKHGDAVIHAGGKTDGTLKKAGKYSGNWVFSKGFYCRNLVISKKETGTNCQKVEIDGNKLRMTRDQGKGDATVYTLN